jgi:hypothetical protein
LEQDGKLVQRLFLCSRWHGPLFGGVAQGQIELLGCGIVAGEVASVFNDFP